MKKGFEKGIETDVESSITILKLLKEHESIPEISKLTGVKEDKVKEISSLLQNQ